MSNATTYDMITLSPTGRGKHVSQIEGEEDARLQSARPNAIGALGQLQAKANSPSGIPRNLVRGRADQVRQRLADLGILESDVDAAIEWARKTP